MRLLKYKFKICQILKVIIFFELSLEESKKSQDENSEENLG